MKELETLKSPYQMDMCWKKMQGYINPPVEIFNVLFKTYSDYGRIHEFACLFDDLHRCYQFGKPNRDSWHYFLKMFCNMKSYYFADLVCGHMKGVKVQIDPELLKEVEQGAAEQEKSLPEIEKWMNEGKKGEPPSVLKTGFDFIKQKEKELYETIPQSIQPPLDWLKVKEVTEADAHK